MNITVERLPDCRANLRVEVPAEDVAKERSGIVKEFSRKVRLPGYRPGKVPSKVVEQRFKNDIDGELLKRLADSSLRKAQEEESLEIIEVPTAKDNTLNSDGTYSFSVEVVTAPEIELPEYKGIAVEVPKMEISDADIEGVLQEMREKFAKYEDVEGRALELGDFAVLDYSCTVDDRPLGEVAPDADASLAAATGSWLKISEDSFLPGFCGQLAGLAVDETREVKVTFPEEIPIEELKMAEGVYSVTLRGIKQQILMDFDDKFATLVGAESIEKLREDVGKNLEQRRDQQRDNMIVNQVISHLNSQTDFELPREMVAREAQSRVNELVERSTSQGATDEQIKEHEQQIIQSASQRAAVSVKSTFILEQIAEREEIKVEQSDIMQRINQLAAQNKMSVKKVTAQLKKNNGVSRIYHDILMTRTLDFLKSNASVTETEPEPAADQSAS